MSVREMSIAHGHLDVGVAQKFLDGLEAGSSHDEVGGEGVAEIVEAEIRNPGLAAGGGKGPFHGVKPVALPITKHIGRFQVVLVTQQLENFHQPATDG